MSWRCVIVIAALLPMACQRSSDLQAGRAAEEVDWAALMQTIAKMHASISSMRPSGNSDVDFATVMLPHHQAAIDMAKAELLLGSDPQMRRVAQEIITDQQSEIVLMERWLKQRGTAPPGSRSGTHP